MVAGLAVTDVRTPVASSDVPTQEQVVRDLAQDFQYALARKGRAPFIMSGLPMFADLCALRETLAQCLQLAEDAHLRQWYTVLDQLLPTYVTPFAEVQQALDWVAEIATILDSPLPTAEEPGEDGDTVALHLAHYLGQLADLTALSPWLTQFRADLLALSERYWAGLFHCYNIVGLPATNNAHESLYGQTKRQLRRQLGFSELRDTLLRRGAWLVFQNDTAAPQQLQARLAQVDWTTYADERERYTRRQAQFQRRYRWRHHRDIVLQQRLADWQLAISDC